MIGWPLVGGAGRRWFKPDQLVQTLGEVWSWHDTHVTTLMCLVCVCVLLCVFK